MGNNQILHTYRVGIGVTISNYAGSTWDKTFVTARRVIPGGGGQAITAPAPAPHPVGKPSSNQHQRRAQPSIAKELQLNPLMVKMSKENTSINLRKNLKVAVPKGR
ncbi:MULTISPECIES: hypothetical protein [unclassified Paenibacillus]|uniref:hypothetical protein n=1 Tax=unclassified Paenibacillus TaxID=185978 RepID=UPI0036D379FD